MCVIKINHGQIILSIMEEFSVVSTFHFQQSVLWETEKERERECERGKEINVLWLQGENGMYFILYSTP